MKKVLEFLSELQINNHRPWFEAHKADYRIAEATFNAFVERLIPSIAAFDASVAGVTLKDCTYRIYRDTRFSPDKTPYKTHMGAYVCTGGKKSGYAGYYFHIEPRGEGLFGGSLLAAGLYMPDAKIVKHVRDDIFDHGDAFFKAISEARGFVFDRSRDLKKTPREFPADHKYADYLRMREYSLIEPVDEKTLLRPDLLDWCLNEFRKVMPINHVLNRSVKFACEEE
ncbi:MAG: DUF2461 domain-containing protein [Rikenellaceae bacterium]|jgi:uncharacterized protein (TIGR02453 family)|nr:DUF2461 domain-containing protein [Rikenellaceae bacterium]